MAVAFIIPERFTGPARPAYATRHDPVASTACYDQPITQFWS